MNFGNPNRIFSDQKTGVSPDTPVFLFIGSGLR